MKQRGISALASCWMLATANGSLTTVQQLRSLQTTATQEAVTPPSIWGYQQGSANGHSDAGGMIYDSERDEIVLVGTTHDNQFFAHDGANSVDCFIATIRLPSVVDEISAKEQAASSPELVEIAEAERVPWVLNGKHRVATTNELDRCDLIAAVRGSPYTTDVTHTFIGGTFATAQTATTRDATAVQPMVYEVSLNHFTTTGGGGGDEETQITTGDPLKLFANDANQVVNEAALPKKDIIIPAMMTAHNENLYFANIHRVLVIPRDQVGSSTATPKLQISLGIAKFAVNDVDPLRQEWSHIEPTSILEVKSDSTSTPHVTSGMFHGDGGKEAEQMAMSQMQIEDEINEIEGEEEAYEEQELMMDMHRHEYKNDGVLISGLEMVELSPTESYLLIAGSAPGTKQARGTNSNHDNADHPFMPHAPSQPSYVGDWDGYVAKIDPVTGMVSQPNLDINTWGYRLATQEKRNDFIQSICVPKIRDGSIQDYHPKVVYAVGTTQGKLVGDKFGGAFLVQLDLVSMDILWKQQIPGMNVHGMACEVWVDVDSHGETLRADSKDLIYIAGEVHGNMKVPLADGKTVLTHGHGETDVFVAQLRASDGKVNWVQQVGTTQQDRLAKNVNNPSLGDGDQESKIGDTGSGKGALVLDKLGNALIYGTTNGSLGRNKTPGDRNRDIFVVRLHRDDGSYKAIVEPHMFVTEHTPAPIGSGGGNSGSSSTPNTPTTVQSAEKATPTHGGATTDATSVNLGIITAGLAVPIVLGIAIILATNRRNRGPGEISSYSTGGSNLHVPFPSRGDPSPPAPPGIEQSLEMSPTRLPSESFAIL